MRVTFADLYKRMRENHGIPKRTFIRYEGYGIEKLRLWHTDGRIFEYDGYTDALYPIGEYWKVPDPPKKKRAKTGHPKYKTSPYSWKQDASDILRERMKEVDMRPCELSAYTGIHKGAISRYLSGKQIPRLRVGEEICAVLNLSIEDLYDKDGGDGYAS